MTVQLINVADLLDPATGKSYREGNAKRNHSIPLGTLVEVLHYNSNNWKDEEYESSYDGLRLYVVAHTRDCDQTPLYSLSHQPYPEWIKNQKIFVGSSLSIPGMGFAVKGELFTGNCDTGYCEEALKVIRGPRNEED